MLRAVLINFLRWHISNWVVLCHLIHFIVLAFTTLCRVKNINEAVWMTRSDLLKGQCYLCCENIYRFQCITYTKQNQYLLSSIWKEIREWTSEFSSLQKKNKYPLMIAKIYLLWRAKEMRNLGKEINLANIF